MKKLIYSHQQFVADIDSLVKELRKNIPFIKDIYGIPRNGLIVATYLSHRINKPLILDKNKITKKTLVVDDISDSGKTLARVLHRKVSYATLTLWRTAETKFLPTYYCQVKPSDFWIVFPWETAKSSKYDHTT